MRLRGKPLGSLLRKRLLGTLLVPASFMLFSCGHSPDTPPQPLMGFFERLTALVTTTVRGEIRESPSKQQLLIALLPRLENSFTMNELTEELKGTLVLRDLAYRIEADVMFELQRPEHHHERVHFNAPEIQRQVVSALVGGMKKALDQLKGGKDGR